MHCAHIYLCIKLQIKIHISFHLIVIWNRTTRAYILVCIWETFWYVMHSYMHAQFAALIAFLVISWLNWWQTRVQFLVRLFMMTQSERAPWAQWWLTGKIVLLTYSLTASRCSTEAHLADVPFPRSFDSRLAQSCSASEKSRWMWMQKNTPVPRLNKCFSCQEKWDKNCSFEQGGQA